MSAPSVPWLRRLPHEPVAPPPPPAPPAPRGEPLVQLSGAPAAPAPAERAPRGPALLLVPPPGVTSAATLDADDPVVRLDALQSGIGALLIRGAEQVAWEDREERAGVVRSDGGVTGDDVPRHGNRSLLRPFEGDVLVTLRHVRALRRLLVDAPADTVVSLLPYCTGTVRAAQPSARLRVSVVVVDGRLEVRLEEGLDDEWRAAAAAMGWSPLALIPRAPDTWA